MVLGMDTFKVIDELVKLDNEIREKFEGIHEYVFECQRCGECCTNDLVLITIPDLVRIIDYTGKSLTKICFKVRNKPMLSLKTVKLSPDKLSEKRKRREKVCIFYDYNEHECKIYPARPFHCYTYPCPVLPYYSTLPTLFYQDDKYITFKCLASITTKCTIRVKDIEVFRELTEKRVKLLKVNEKLLAYLFARGIFEIAIEEYMKKRGKD